MVAAAPTRRQAMQSGVPLDADPFVIFLVVLFLLQAAMFMALGGFFSRRSQRAVVVKLEAVGTELKNVRDAHQKLCARTRATNGLVERIYLTPTGDRAHLSKARCPSLRHSVDLRSVEVCLHCQRLGPDTGP